MTNAIDYAQRTKRVILVDWSDGKFCLKGTNAFPLLFRLKDVESISTFADITDISEKSSYPPIWKHTPEKSVYDLYRRGGSTFFNEYTIIRKFFQRYFSRSPLLKLQRHWYLNSEKHNPNLSYTVQHAIRTLFSKNDISAGGDLSLRLKEDIVFFVDYCPKFEPCILTDRIRLQPAIENEIDEFSEKYKLGTNCIGVHIRMTDMMPTNTLDYLFEKIKKIPTAEAYVKKEYPNVISISKMHIDLPEGMGRHNYALSCGYPSMAEVIYHESVMDIFLLSRCRYLIAQANSSFSRVAAILRNEPSKVSWW